MILQEGNYFLVADRSWRTKMDGQPVVAFRPRLAFTGIQRNERPISGWIVPLSGFRSWRNQSEITI